MIYTYLKYQGKTSLDYQYTSEKLRNGRKNRSFPEEGTSQRGWAQGKWE
jgi:hypothetical protein